MASSAVKAFEVLANWSSASKDVRVQFSGPDDSITLRLHGRIEMVSESTITFTSYEGINPVCKFSFPLSDAALSVADGFDEELSRLESQVVLTPAERGKARAKFLSDAGVSIKFFSGSVCDVMLLPGQS